MLFFEENNLLLQNTDTSLPLRFAYIKPKLTLYNDANSLEFINLSVFIESFDIAPLAGTYVNDDLSFYFELDELGFGNITKGSKGIDFTCMVYDNIIRCTDIKSGFVFYFEYQLDDMGISLAELPREFDDNSNDYLVKIK